MKKISLFFVWSLLSIGLMAQNTIKAKKLLDEVSLQIKNYDNIVFNFKHELYNQEENIRQHNYGDIIVEQEKYHLDYQGITQMFDGKKIYSIIPENEEIIIEDKLEEDENTINPLKMLTFYQDGYHYEWDILQKVKDKKIQYIKLTPIDSYSEIKKILLGIDTNSKNIYKLIQIGTDNTKTTITINSLKTNQTLPKSLFTFDENQYEGYLISRN